MPACRTDRLPFYRLRGFLLVRQEVLRPMFFYGVTSILLGKERKPVLFLFLVFPSGRFFASGACAFLLLLLHSSSIVCWFQMSFFSLLPVLSDGVVLCACWVFSVFGVLVDLLATVGIRARGLGYELNELKRILPNRRIIMN